MNDEIDTLWQERADLLSAEEEPIESFELDCTCEHPDCICPIHNSEKES
jgi:hypothetical protein